MLLLCYCQSHCYVIVMLLLCYSYVIVSPTTYFSARQKPSPNMTGCTQAHKSPTPGIEEPPSSRHPTPKVASTAGINGSYQEFLFIPLPLSMSLSILSVLVMLLVMVLMLSLSLLIALALIAIIVFVSVFGLLLLSLNIMSSIGTTMTARLQNISCLYV